MKFFPLLVCLCSQFVVAQNGFNQSFGIADFGCNGASIVVLNDSTFLLGGSAGTNMPYKVNLMLAHIEKYGDTLWSKVTVLPGDENWNAKSLVIETDSTFVVEGTWGHNGLTTETQHRFAKINLQGDTLWTLRVGDDTLVDSSGKMIREAGGNYVCSGWSFDQDDETKERILLTKVSKDGAVVFEKRFPIIISGYQQYQGFSVAQVDDGSYVVVGQKFPDSTPLTPAADIYYIKVDSTGNPLWNKQIQNAAWDAAKDVVAAGNNGFVLCGYKSYQVGAAAYHEKLWIGRCDEDGNVIDQNLYTDGSESYVEPYRMIHTSDGGYVVVGMMDSVFNHSKAFVVKFDSLLDFKWARYYKRAYADYFQADLFSDVKETLDLGLIASGRTVEASPDTAQNVWLVKMDSLGCDVPGCDTLGTAVQPLLTAGEFAVIAFPNPAKDKVYFKYRLPNGVTKAELVIVGTAGKEAKRLTVTSNAGVTSCNLFGFSSGPYLVTLRVPNGGAASCKLIIE